MRDCTQTTPNLFTYETALHIWLLSNMFVLDDTSTFLKTRKLIGR